MSNPISPTHYKNQVPNIECIEVTEHFNFNRGNAIKYIWRAGEKDKDRETEDLQKAIWYLEREIERVISYDKYHTSKIKIGEKNV